MSKLSITVNQGFGILAALFTRPVVNQTRVAVVDPVIGEIEAIDDNTALDMAEAHLREMREHDDDFKVYCATCGEESKDVTHCDTCQRPICRSHYSNYCESCGEILDSWIEYHETVGIRACEEKMRKEKEESTKGSTP